MDDHKIARGILLLSGYLGLGVASLMLFVGITMVSATLTGEMPLQASVAQAAQPAALPMALPPRCAIATNHETYAPSAPIIFYWLAANTVYAALVPDPSDPQALALSNQPFGSSGKQYTVATTPGTHYITLLVHNEVGMSSTCSKAIIVTNQ